MRPYWAVIYDSFREALASRVLWILIVLITVFLVALAPMGITEKLSSQLWPPDIRDPLELGKQLHREFTAREPSPGKHIWKLLDKKTQQELKKAAEAPKVANVTSGVFQLFEKLNGLLGRRDFYDADAWQNSPLDKEAEDLIALGVDQLDDAQLRRLNRLLLESAYRGLIAVSPPTSAQLTYFGVEMFDPIPASRDDVAKGFLFLLNLLMTYLVGVVAVFVAILVTSPIIPQMFEAGSIELLLSKPISRVLLFLTKFVGGCSFVLLNSAYLIGGIWLVAGARLGIWEHRLFSCIPIFLFLFMIYYSVSALAGLIWRSAIVCVIVSILFWATCFTVGLSKNIIEARIIVPNRIVGLIPSAEALFCLTEHNSVSLWNAGERKWDYLFDLGSSPFAAFSFVPLPKQPLLEPVFLAEKQMLFTAPLNERGERVTLAGATLVGQSALPNKRPGVFTEMPASTLSMFAADDQHLVAVSLYGIHRISADDLRDEVSSREKLLLGIPQFTDVYTPEALSKWYPRAAALDPATGDIVIWHRSHVARYENGGARYVLRQTREFEESNLAVALAFAGSTILTANSDGQILVLDAKTLEVQTEFRPEPDSPPRFVRAAPTGNWFAILFHNKKLWLYNSADDSLESPALSGQGEFTGATLTDADQILVADETTVIRQYDLPGLNPMRTISPELSTTEWIYYHSVMPLYRVLPKPGELDQTTHYLLHKTESVELSSPSNELAAPRVQVSPWAPVISSAIFTAFVLLICCVYMHRAEF